VVESHAVVAPSAVVTPGTKVLSGELWAGKPAKKVRSLTLEEIQSIQVRATETAQLASQHALEHSKDYQTLVEEEEMAEIDEYLDESAPRMGPRDAADVLGQGYPGRIFRSTLSHPEEAFGPIPSKPEESKQNAA
jgi:hypothetical protein